MKGIDFLILALVFGVIVLGYAVRSYRRKQGKSCCSGCDGCCSGCSKSCHIK